MHGFKLGESIYIGCYKYEGLSGDLTFTNSRSDLTDVARMQKAYDRRDKHTWPAFVERLFTMVAPEPSRRGAKRVLDLARATGQLSLRAVDLGFGAVWSSEIRPNQSAPHQLLLDCLEDPKYRRAITVIQDPVSADLDGFAERYRPLEVDVVLSFGLLYHLANPLQHLINLRDITCRYAIVYTMTHMQPFARRSCYLTIENPQWITKATSSVSWVPHFLEVARLAREVGFSRVHTVYPEMFSRHFPAYDRYTRGTDVKLLAERIVERLTGVRLGTARNQRFEYFRDAYVNPNYFAYVLEK